ncbi:MAG TPA: Gfo/Idh/MocA family oxidoreductase [Roseiflexaceae bacterium]|nr:Gfo/Idh/MocA family oxidoreductase [Roseiflexaceae bacterium]
MIHKEARLLRIGVLGAGPIAQAAHLDATRKARNAELYAICDTAGDLLERVAAIHPPTRTYTDYDTMLADPQVEAVIVAVADQFHVPLARRALAAGRHVLVEKPLGVAVEECEELRADVRRAGLVLQVGNNRRFDPGIAFARRFVREELGQLQALKAWYYDSAYRYTMTDNLQPAPLSSARTLRPAGDPKADRRRYLLLTHGSHLVDTARFLGGEIVRVQARYVERGDSHCWFVAVDFADGTLGHLDMIIPVRGDFEEGFQVFGEGGSVQGRAHLPWYHKASHVECFSARERRYQRVLGEDAYTYKLQIESFADTILRGAPQHGATVDDGAAAVRALVAIARSAERGAPVALADVAGGV